MCIYICMYAFYTHTYGNSTDAHTSVTQIAPGLADISRQSSSTLHRVGDFSARVGATHRRTDNISRHTDSMAFPRRLSGRHTGNQHCFRSDSLRSEHD